MARVVQVADTFDAMVEQREYNSPRTVEDAVAELRREARALLARSACPLVVDLTAVRTAEPAASAVLRDLAYDAGDADVDLRIVRDPAASEVARTLLGDETLFELYPSLDAALDGLADGPSPGGHAGAGGR
jgi:hypothetical protein